MTQFVLDNSVAMRWFMPSNKPADQTYSENVLRSFSDPDVDALVPNLWHLEAVNVLLMYEKRENISAGQLEGYIIQLEGLPLYVDPLTVHHAFSRTLSLARAYNLSSYDASYLELAIRESLPIATLDKKLAKAAIKSNIEIYLKPSNH